MTKFTQEERARIKKEIDLAFEAVKKLIREPKKIETLPDESVILPIEVQA